MWYFNEFPLLPKRLRLIRICPYEEGVAHGDDKAMFRSRHMLAICFKDKQKRF